MTLIREKQVSFKTTDDGIYIQENYNLAKPFSNFLPGIAGPYGVPLWAFYVNRGQGIASFGVQDKNHPIMPFAPANRAYEETSLRGFRTFLKVIQKREANFYEPFQNFLHGQNYETIQRLYVKPWGFTLEERNMSLGLEIWVEYFGLPNEPLGALARRTTIKNVSLMPLHMEVLDGLPSILPYGLTDFFLKCMGRTVEAWIEAKDVQDKAQMSAFQLKSDPFDRPEFKVFKGTHFYSSFIPEPKGKVRYTDHIVDPSVIFGPNLNFSHPRNFLLNTPFKANADQVREGRTPCAFSFQRVTLQPQDALTLCSYVGQASSKTQAQTVLRQINSGPSFDAKLEEQISIIKGIQAPLTTLSASRTFDGYCGQTYLDNTLRGGYPSVLSKNPKARVLHLYSRKHGDLERDYNQFVMNATYLSQGEGNYRDMNQNRRCEVWFEPRVGYQNILQFFNLLQIDGFNPLVVQPARLRFPSITKLKNKLAGILPKESVEDVAKFLEDPHTPGEVLKRLEDKHIQLNGSKDIFIDTLLTQSEKTTEANHERGFWADHWYYNLDLIENYLAIFPEKLEHILLKVKEFTFYDSEFVVVPRSEKYKLVGKNVRQLGAVVIDPEKVEMFKSRGDDPNVVRTRNGKGKVYQTTLFSKMICLIVNKYASLDPSGVGMEMDADRPDWLDSLNGLPAMFGSSSSGVYELMRFISFLRSAIQDMSLSKQAALAIPAEAAVFLQKLQLCTKRYLGTRKSSRDFSFWDESHNAKEEFWDKTRLGFQGRETRVLFRKLDKTLELFSKKLKTSVQQSYDSKKEICPTYFVHELSVYREVPRKGKGKTGKVILPKTFKLRKLPPFLEGPVHALRVETDRNRASQIYNAVRSSELFDRKLGMYRICTPLHNEPLEIGRIRAFMRGWLENEAIFLHMEYKFLLEVLKRGLADAFFTDLKSALVPFHDPKQYGRSILENSSFIVSSVCRDKNLHGTGFAARLSGATSEFLDMWLTMNVGEKPFFLDDDDKLALQLNPTLPAWFFTEKDAQREWRLSDGRKQRLYLPKHTYAFMFLGTTLVTYHNPKRKPTYGARRCVVKRISFQDAKGTQVVISGNVLSQVHAQAVREGKIKRLDVELG